MWTTFVSCILLQPIAALCVLLPGNKPGPTTPLEEPTHRHPRRVRIEKNPGKKIPKDGTIFCKKCRKSRYGRNFFRVFAASEVQLMSKEICIFNFLKVF